MTGMASMLNSLVDISFDDDYSTLCGFTRQEIKENFSNIIEHNAHIKNMTAQDYLDQMERHYGGFSFDGFSHVSNPYSTLSCLRENKFGNFWFSALTSTFLMKYFSDKNLSIVDFAEYPINKNEIYNSIWIERTPPELLLYQAGYLTLETMTDELDYLLNYPNLEVFSSLGATLSHNIYSNAVDTQRNIHLLADALKSCYIQDILHAFEFAFDCCGHDTFDGIKKKKHITCESFLRDMLAIYMMATYAIDVSKEVFGSRGRADIVASYANRIYVFE
jgi:hypothetical protein